MPPLKILWLFLIILQFQKSSAEKQQLAVPLNKFYNTNTTEKYVNIPIQNEILALNKTNLYSEQTNATRSFIDENLTLKPTQTTQLFTTENPLTKSIIHKGTENREDEKETIIEDSLTTTSHTEHSINTTKTNLKGALLADSNLTAVEKDNLFDYEVTTEIYSFLNENSTNNADDVLESVEDIFSKSGDYEFISADRNESHTNSNVSKENNNLSGDIKEFASIFEKENTRENTISSTNFEIPYDYYDSIDSTTHTEEKMSTSTTQTNIEQNQNTSIVVVNTTADPTTTEKINTTEPIPTSSSDYDFEMVKILYPAFESNIYDDILHDLKYLAHEMTMSPIEEKNNATVPLEALDYMNEYLANDDDLNITTSSTYRPNMSETTETSVDTTTITTTEKLYSGGNATTEKEKDENCNTLYQVDENFTKIIAKSLHSHQKPNVKTTLVPNFQKNICFEEKCFLFNCTIKILINNSVEYLPENASSRAVMDSVQILLNITWTTDNFVNFSLQFDVDSNTKNINKTHLSMTKGNKIYMMTKENLNMGLTSTEEEKVKIIDFGNGLSIHVIKCKFLFYDNEYFKRTKSASEKLENLVNKCYTGEIIGGSVALSGLVIFILYFVYKKIRNRRNDFKPSDV